MAAEKGSRAKERIREAAIDLFSRKGFDATSVREIVAQAEVSKPTLYYYFGSKETLAQGLLLEASREFSEAILARAHAEVDLKELVAAVIHDHHMYVKRHAKLIRFLFSVVFGNTSQGCSESVLSLSQERRAETEEMLRRAALRRGLSREASRQLAQMTMGIINAGIMYQVANAASRMTLERARATAGFLVSGACHYDREDDRT